MMRTNKYEITLKHIVSGSLVSLTSQYWLSENNTLTPWSGSVYIGPEQNDIIYNTNVSGSLVDGYYTWTGTTWNEITKSEAYNSHQIPVFLEADLDEYGVMVSFDGDIEQIEQLCNFTYSGSGNTITVYNTTNTNRLKKIVDATFVVNWGDATTSSINILGNVSHTYSSPGFKNIKITMNTPWLVQNTEKTVKVPLVTGYTGSYPLGTLTFTVPYSSPETGQTQNYINDYDSATGYTGTTTVIGVGSSRIDELKLYGSAGGYSGVTTGSTTIESVTYTYKQYVLDGLTYMDLSDGTTYITGDTSTFETEYVIDAMLTRNEHFLGFVSDPVIYSDVFVERGKQGVSEYNLRLSDIDNLGELDVYGNGFFTVRKQ